MHSLQYINIQRNSRSNAKDICDHFKTYFLPAEKLASIYLKHISQVLFNHNPILLLILTYLLKKFKQLYSIVSKI